MAAARLGEKDQIGALTDTAAEIKRPISDLHRAVRAISLIATNARIVAVGFVSSNNKDVVAFTADMVALGRRVNDAVSAISRSYEQLMSHLNAARRANQAFMIRHGTTLAHILETLEIQLTTIEGHRTRAEKVASERRERTSQIRARTGQAIVAVQIGDITRQRIEHVEAALETVHSWPQDAIAGPDAFTAIYHLQCQQLDAAIANYDTEVCELADSIKQLAQHASAVLKEGNSEAESLLSAGSMALSELIGEVRRICILADEFESSWVEREKVVDGVAGSVAELVRYLETIRAIQQQIRLLSFNATIQCSQVGDEDHGRALGAVAQQLREISSQTITATRAIMDGLSGADEQTRLLTMQRLSLGSRGAMSIKEGALDAIKVYESVTDKLRAGAETLETTGGQAVRLLDGAAQRVSDQQSISIAWRRANSRLRQLIESSSKTPIPEAVDRAIADQLRSLYTMEDERKIHDKFFGRSLDFAAMSPITGTEQSLEDMLL